MTTTMPRFVDSGAVGPTEAERAVLRASMDLVASSDAGIANLQATRSLALATAVQVVRDQVERSGGLVDEERLRDSYAAMFSMELRVSPTTVKTWMGESETLVGSFPATLTALGEGRITNQHVRVITDVGADLPDQVRGVFEERAIRVAEESSPRRLREAAAKIAESLQPGLQEERREQATRRRGVFVRNLPDGQAELCIRDGAALVHGVFHRVTEMARVVRDDARAAKRDAHPAPAGSAEAEGEFDERTLGQVRADLAIDMLLTGAPTAHTVEGDCEQGRLGAITATVQVVIPVESLAGIGDEGAFLAGYGPLSPDVARRFAKNAPGWERVFGNVDTGAIENVDRYQPTAAIRRLIEVRDRTCRMGFCDRPAARCDKDHSIPHSTGGDTGHHNLACLCRRHHTLKHHEKWTLEQPRPGLLIWTDPLGVPRESAPPGETLRTVLGEHAPPF